MVTIGPMNKNTGQDGKENQRHQFLKRKSSIATRLNSKLELTRNTVTWSEETEASS